MATSGLCAGALAAPSASDPEPPVDVPESWLSTWGNPTSAPRLLRRARAQLTAARCGHYTGTGPYRCGTCPMRGGLLRPNAQPSPVRVRSTYHLVIYRRPPFAHDAGQAYASSRDWRVPRPTALAYPVDADCPHYRQALDDAALANPLVESVQNQVKVW